jgi:hypothetical protein
MSLVLAAFLCLQGPATQPSRLVFEIRPVLDLDAHVRALAGGGGAIPEALQPAVAAARTVENVLGRDLLRWGVMLGATAGCDTADEVLRAFLGRSIALRATALEYGAALRDVEPAFLESLWPERRALIEAALARLTTDFTPREAQCLAFHLESLGMRDPGIAIPVALTATAPFPGAVTYRGVGDRGVAFVAVEGQDGSQLFETVLHEATHAFDLAAGEASVLFALQRRLEEAGVGPRDRRLRELPHALMFVQSAASIRRTVAHEHVDYGVVSGLYTRLGPAAEIVRGIWVDHLEGSVGRDEALASIVEEALALR